VFNSNGNREVTFGTDNPQWNLFDGTGDFDVVAIPANRYGNWTLVEFTFNFDNGTYDYLITNEPDGGNTRATGTRQLEEGLDADQIALGDSLGGDGNSSDSMWWDLITISKRGTAEIFEINTPNILTRFGLDKGINGVVDNSFALFGIDEGVDIEKSEKDNTFANFRS
jgi:hypothetical protein